MQSRFSLGIVLVALLYSVSASSQNQSKIASIKDKLQSAKNLQRFDLLNDLAWEYRFANPDTAIILSRQAFSLGESIQLKTGLARALNITGIASNYNGNKIIAYDYYMKALTVSREQNDSAEIGYTYNNLGRVFQEQGLIDKAFPNITKATDIFRKINDSTGLAYCYQSLGYLYQSQRNYEKGAENHMRALAIRIRLHNQRNIQAGFHMLGRLYAEQGLETKSMNYLLKADSVGRLQGDEIQLAETWIYLAKSYLLRGDVHKADSIAKVSLEIIRERKSIRILSNALLVSAEIAIREGKVSRAKKMLDEAIANSKKVDDRVMQRDIYFQLWKLHEKNNDQLAALYNQNQYLLIKDTLKNLDVVRQENQLEFERTILNRETENQKLKAENHVIAQQRKFHAIMFGVGLLFVLVIWVFMWLNVKRTKSIGRLLSKKNEMLLQSDQEKNALMSVVAHDLKAPLNKIQGLSNLLKSDGELSAGQKQYIQFIDRVIADGMSFISDLLSVHAFEENQIPELTTFDAAQVIRERTDTALAIGAAKKIKVMRHLEQVTVKSDSEYIGRIVDNLVSNAMKFSPEHSEVRIVLEKKQEQFVISVEDQGPGFSAQDRTIMFKRFKKLSARPTGGETSNGLGLAIVKTLVERLSGTIELESREGEGSKFTVTLPGVTGECEKEVEMAKTLRY